MADEPISPLIPSDWLTPLIPSNTSHDFFELASLAEQGQVSSHRTSNAFASFQGVTFDGGNGGTAPVLEIDVITCGEWEDAETRASISSEEHDGTHGGVVQMSRQDLIELRKGNRTNTIVIVSGLVIAMIMFWFFTAGGA